MFILIILISKLVHVHLWQTPFGHASGVWLFQLHLVKALYRSDHICRLLQTFQTLLFKWHRMTFLFRLNISRSHWTDILSVGPQLPPRTLNVSNRIESNLIRRGYYCTIAWQEQLHNAAVSRVQQICTFRRSRKIIRSFGRRIQQSSWSVCRVSQL